MNRYRTRLFLGILLKTHLLPIEDLTQSIKRVKSPVTSDDLKQHEVWSKPVGATLGLLFYEFPSWGLINYEL